MNIFLFLLFFILGCRASSLAGLLVLSIDKEKERAGLLEEKAWVWRDLLYSELGWTIPRWAIRGPDGEDLNIRMLSIALTSCNLFWGLNQTPNDVCKSSIYFSQRPFKMNIYFEGFKSTLQLFNIKRRIEGIHNHEESYPFALASKGSSPGKLKIWIDENIFYEDEGMTEIGPIFEKGIKVYFKSAYSIYPHVFNNIQVTDSEVGKTSLFWNTYNSVANYEGLIFIARNTSPPYGFSILLVKSNTIGKWTMFPKLLDPLQAIFDYNEYSGIFPQLPNTEYRQRRSGFAVLQSKINNKYLSAAMIKVEPEWIPNIASREYQWMSFAEIYPNRGSLLDSYSLCLFDNLYNEYAMKVPLLPVVIHLFVIEKLNNEYFIWMNCDEERCIFPTKNSTKANAYANFDDEFFLERFGFRFNQDQYKGTVSLSVIDNERLILEEYVGFTLIPEIVAINDLKKINLEELLHNSAFRTTVNDKCLVRVHLDKEYLVDIPWIFSEPKFVERLYTLRFNSSLPIRYEIIIKDAQKYKTSVSTE